MNSFIGQHRHLRDTWARTAAGLLAGTACIVLSGTVHAFPAAPPSVTYDVNTLEDLADADLYDSLCADANGHCSLRAAVQNANYLANTVGGSSVLINLPGGTYTLTITGADEIGGNTGDLNFANGTLHVLGSSDATNPTIIEGGPSWDDRLIRTWGSTLTLENLVLRGGNANSTGGAIQAGDGTTLLLKSCRITGNAAVNSGGGVAAPGLGISMTIESCRIDSNTTGGSGGGIYTTADVTVIRDSSVDGNSSADRGGGLFAYSSAPGPTSVINTTVSGNHARSGGGVYALSPVGLYNVTVTANVAAGATPSEAARGGGLYAAYSTTIRDSVLAGNSGGYTPTTTYVSSPDCDGSADITSGGYNLVGDDTSCGVFIQATGDLIGTAATPIDPVLGGLQDNGGATPTHALLTGSPAIDAGDPNGCVDEAALALSTDQRGFSRPVDGNQDGGAVCDMGAFELAAAVTTASTSGGGGGGSFSM